MRGSHNGTRYQEAICYCQLDGVALEHLFGLSPRLQYGLEPLPLQYKMAAATHSFCGSCAMSRTNFMPGRQSLQKEVSLRMPVTQVLVSL